jgi:hypothetical protein
MTDTLVSMFRTGFFQRDPYTGETMRDSTGAEILSDYWFRFFEDVVKVSNNQASTTINITGKVKIDSADTIEKYLQEKLIAGSNIALTESFAGDGSKILTLSASTEPLKWSQDGSNIYYNSGYVSVGTDTPLSAFTAADPTGSYSGQQVVTIQGYHWTMGNGTVLAFADENGFNVGGIRSITEDTQAVGLAFYTYDEGIHEVVRIAANGFVGIGIDPVTEFHALGTGIFECDAPQLYLTGHTNPNQTLCLGFDTVEGVGWIDAFIYGAGYVPLVLNPYGTVIVPAPTYDNNAAAAYYHPAGTIYKLDMMEEIGAYVLAIVG